MFLALYLPYLTSNSLTSGLLTIVVKDVGQSYPAPPRKSSLPSHYNATGNVLVSNPPPFIHI